MTKKKKQIRAEKNKKSRAEASATIDILPSKASTFTFLLITLFSMIVISFSIGSLNMILDFFAFSSNNATDLSMIGLLFATSIFTIINVMITRGSLKCVFYLKIYMSLLIVLSLLSFLTFNPLVETKTTKLTLIQISLGLLNIYLMSRKYYIKRIQYQYDHVNFFKILNEKMKR